MPRPELSLGAKHGYSQPSELGIQRKRTCRWAADPFDRRDDLLSSRIPRVWSIQGKRCRWHSFANEPPRLPLDFQYRDRVFQLLAIVTQLSFRQAAEEKEVYARYLARQIRLVHSNSRE